MFRFSCRPPDVEGGVHDIEERGEESAIRMENSGICFCFVWGWWCGLRCVRPPLATPPRPHLHHTYGLITFPCILQSTNLLQPLPPHSRTACPARTAKNSSSSRSPPTIPRTVLRVLQGVKVPLLTCLAAAAATATARSGAAGVPAVLNRGMIPPNAVPPALRSPQTAAAETAEMVERRTSSTTSATCLCR